MILNLITNNQKDYVTEYGLVGFLDFHISLTFLLLFGSQVLDRICTTYFYNMCYTYNKWALKVYLLHKLHN